MAYIINTINEFLALPPAIQVEIQKSLKMKDRLMDWLRSQNKKELRVLEEGKWVQCRCSKSEYPGWYWVEGEEERDNSDIHPSQIHKCLKKLWYDVKGAEGLEEFIDPVLRMLFDLGHTWHHTVQGYGRKGAWGTPYRYEIPMDPDAKTFDGVPILPVAAHYRFKGSADGILDAYEVPKVPGIGDVVIRVIHEYKTISSSGYTKLTRPKPEHKMQATIYSAVFDIPFVVYLYTNKDNSQMADFPVPFDVSIWNSIVAKVQRVLGYAHNELVPPWDETSAVKNPVECTTCGYNKICQPPIKGGKRT